MPLLLAIACVDTSHEGGELQVDGGPAPIPEDDTIVDTFVIGDPKIPADVLVAVDPETGFHMTFEEQVLPSLLGMLDMLDPDWRVAVTSTALGDADETAYLAPTGEDGGRWLSGEDLGDPAIDWTDFPNEPPWGATGATYLTASADLYGFLRPEATLYLVLLSDNDTTPEAIVTFDAWAAWVSAEDAVVSAWTTDDTLLAVVARASGGVTVDPSGGDVAAWAAAVGFLPYGAPSSYRLSRLPIQGTITVAVEDPSGATFEFFEAVGDPPVGDWIYRDTTNSVEFLTYAPANDARVLVEYVPRGE